MNGSREWGTFISGNQINIKGYSYRNDGKNQNEEVTVEGTGGITSIVGGVIKVNGGADTIDSKGVVIAQYFTNDYSGNHYLDLENGGFYLEDSNKPNYYTEHTPGDITLHAEEGSTQITGAQIVCKQDGGTVEINPQTISGMTAQFRQVKLCVDGQQMTAWILMTEPEAVA
jgi:hypothetical protein